MSSAKFRRAISSIYDAALVPELWPAALQSVMDQLGAVGAGYSLFDRRTERVEWLSQSGSLVGREADYFSYYHELDRYRPILEVLPAGGWLRISECLPEPVLRRAESSTRHQAGHAPPYFKYCISPGSPPLSSISRRSLADRGSRLS